MSGVLESPSARPAAQLLTTSPAIAQYDAIFSNSLRMRAVREIIERVAPTDATVLVWGESGVGKELVSRALHQRSPRRDRPFVKVNCAALPFELLESELFGYERGAFTGAHRRKPGKFELANTGTIFLDEIGEMPLALQAKLLHVLQDREFSRLGGQQDIRLDVRVVAATNKKLSKLVEAGAFRDDLYYRLNVMSIYVPPLRERLEEIPSLVDRDLDQYAREYARPPRSLSAEALRLFMEYPWPGNVRELENAVRRIVVLESEEPVIQELRAKLHELDSSLALGATALSVTTEQPPKGSVTAYNGLGLKQIAQEAVRRAEATAIKEVLDRVHWRRIEAARQLKVSYKTLLSKMKRHGLEVVTLCASSSILGGC